MSGNAAIQYQKDGFHTSGPRLMGRHAAGEGFLKGFARHADVERFYCYAADRPTYDDFEHRIATFAGTPRPCHWIPARRPHDLSVPGMLFRSDPGVAEMAWLRRHGDSRAYGLCGITHTIASAGVMDALGALAVAPVQPWDALICTSEAVRAAVEHVLENWCAYLEERVGARPEIPLQRPVIPLGVDCAALADSPASRAARAGLRQRLKIADDDVVALYMGRLSFHAKAHPLPMYLGLEEAARQTGNRVHLILAGWFANDSIRDEFQAAARAFCPSVNVVHLDGRDPAVRAQVWFAADLFTSLSDNIQETFGLVPIEAMAAGLPMVVSDWDGYRDTVRHGIDGFAVPTRMPAPGLGADLARRFHAEIDSYDRYIGHVSQTTSVDVAATAEAFTALVGQPDLRRRMAEAGRARAREIYDWRVVIGAYQALWRDLAERRQSETEHTPRAAAAPAHPLRDDPYALYAGYATAPIGGGDWVELAPGAGPDRLSRLRVHDMNSFATQVLAGDGDAEAVLRHLDTRGRCTVDRLLSSFAPEKRTTVHRTIGWLAKMGLVRLPGKAAEPDEGAG